MGLSVSNKISWQLTSEALTVVFPDGEQTVISRDDPRFRTAVTAIRNKDFSRETFNKFKDARKVLETWGSGRVLISKDNTLTVVDGGVEHPVNEKLSQVIMEYIRNDWPVEAFAKFVIRLMKNPSMRSRDLFYDFIKLYNIAITDTGMCRAYKAITNDWKDKHTRKVDNRIGITVPPFTRSQVDDNPDNACSFGYHAGSIDYVRMFASGYGTRGGDRIVLVEFDPANVVCVPRDSAQQKIRCTVYTVISEFTGELSSYAPILQADSLSDESTPDFDPEGFEVWGDSDSQGGDDTPDFCPMCGQELPVPEEGAINFCPFCGEALT